MKSNRLVPCRLICACLTLMVSAAQADVGRTPGSAEVSPTGTANYTVPIWTPPGSGGMTPSLALAYSHLDDNGLVGVGWRIGGLSIITRCNKTYAQDGLKAGPQLVAADAYCLDGNKLRLESGTAGTNGAVYRTEMETYSRVTAFGTAGGGPAWFQVQTKDGAVYEYGNTADSRIVTYGTSTARLWAVSSVRDPSGNRTEFVYVNDAANGSYRPDEIRYATNPNAGLSSAPYAVKFVYENRPDGLLGYAFGSASVDGRVNESRRLDRIEIRYQGNPIRIYDVAYGAGTFPNFRSLVQSITECSTSLANCFAPSSFTYTPSNNPLYEAEVALGTPVSGSAMDVNGDGREDWVYPSQGTWRFRLSLGTTLGTEVNTGIAYGNMATWMPIDWDGDGRKDILSGVTGGFWQVVRANGLSGFDPTVSTGTAFESGATYSTMDQNGDGRDDLLRLPPAKDALYVHYRQGTGFAAPVLVNVGLTNTSGGILFDNADKQRMHKRWLDFNGDGLEDGFIRYQATRRTTDGTGVVVQVGQALMSGDGNGYGGAEIPMANYQQATWFGDFNGDGLTDIATPGFVHFSRGGAFVTVAGPSFDTIVGGVLDFNGDGRDDLLLRQPAGHLCAYYSVGSTLNPCIETEVGVGMSSLAVADVSGDGFADLIGTNSAGQFVLQLHSQTPADLLLTATDGFNVSATFTYAPLTDSSVYVKGIGAPYPTVDIQTPNMVVKKLRKTDGLATGTGFYDLDYTYSIARYDHDGRGFLGFASRSITDSRAGYNLRTLETYAQVFPYIGALQSVEIRQSDGTLIRSGSYTWSALSWGTEQSNARKFPYVSASTLRQYEVGGPYNATHIRTVTTTVASGGIDTTSGLIKDVTRTTTEVATGLNTGATHTERHVHTSVFNDTANWCLGKPEQTQLINSHSLPGGVQAVRTSSASWDGIRCRPTQIVEEPGSVQWQVAKAYGYDNSGNANTVTVTPATGQGQATRTTTIDWGTDGRFPRTVTNAKGHVTQLQWDADTGACTAGTSYLGTLRCITDPNGLKTRFDVDAFGRIVREQQPDGTATDYVLGVCNASNSYCGSADLRTSLQIIARDTSNNAIRTDSQYLDAFDRPRYVYQQIMGGGNSATITQYDALGRVSSQSMPFTSGDPTSYTTYAYDLLGRPTSMQRQTSEVDTSLSTWQIAYRGLTTVVTDPLGYSRTTVGDAVGRIVQAIDAAGGDTDYEYDAFGNLLKTRDFHGNEITLTYNVRGMKMSSSDPDLGNWAYDYFPLGELKKQTDAKSQELTFSYDALSRPVLRHESEGDTNWYWDTATKGVGQLDYVTSPGGYVERYYFDSSGRPYQNDITADGATYSYNTTYNSAGLVETLTYPTSTAGVRFKVRYGYQYGVMQQVRDYTGDVLGATFWQANAANARNQVLDTQLGNGLRTIDSYDRITGQLDSRTSGPSGDTTIQNLAYDYNKAGWLTQRQDLRQNLTEAFAYDALGRMTSSTLNGAQNLSLTYDAIGNILSKSNVTSATWTYDAVKKHAVKTAGSYTFSYDANGNVISDGTGGTISWHSYNLPNLIQSPSTAGTVSSQILYGHARQRYKQIAVAGPISETTIYVGGLLRKVTFGCRSMPSANAARRRAGRETFPRRMDWRSPPPTVTATPDMRCSTASRWST